MLALHDKASRDANLDASFTTTITNPIALDDDRLKTATTVTVGTPTVLRDADSDFTAQPDVDRNANLTWVSSVGVVKQARVLISGLDQFGEARQERIVVRTVATRVEGRVIWKAGSVLVATMEVVGAPAATASLKLGVGKKLGTGVKLGKSTDLHVLTADGTAEAIAATDVVESSFTATTDPDGAHDYVLTGRSSWGQVGSLGA